MKKLFFAVAGLAAVALAACGPTYDVAQPLDNWKSDKGSVGEELQVTAGETLTAQGDYRNFELKGQALLEEGAEASLLFHSDGKKGYEVILHNGAIDGTRKTGSLATVRNLYRSLGEDGQWFDFDIAVREKNISIKINGTDVVCYTEPDQPYRTEANKDKVLGKGGFALVGKQGNVKLQNLTVTRFHDGVTNPNDTMPVVDETTDEIIQEMAHAMEMNYGINYGVAPNLGEGGVGRMLSNDQEAFDYYNEVKPMAFLMGAQGEGRRWIVQFSEEAINKFDYLFTDAMTVVDKGRICRIYRPEEVHLDGRTKQQYMDMIVDQTVKILTNEPADIYANATYIPDDMNVDYAQYWTDERVDKVLDVLEKYDIALEISPRYKIPSFDVIKKAKARGLKFTFGTNNVDADFGKCEYAIQAIKECGITADDIWFPSMSKRAGRKAVDYNHFADTVKK